MLFSKRWAEQFVDISDLSTNDIVESLTMAGLEVESYDELFDVSDVVVAQIQESENIPSSSSLKYCRIYDGTKEYNVVCGAPSAKKGLKVAFARPFARLANNKEIKPLVISGIKSEGMLCSAADLGLESKSDDLLILDDKYDLGYDVNNIIELPDTIFDVSITPNRGDLLSIRGISRELASIFGKEFRDISFNLTSDLSESEFDSFSVNVEDSINCPLYIGKIIKDVEISNSPTIIASRLIKHGINIINNVVDISNYILIETNQPLHTFDLDLLEGNIIVRKARSGERLKLLDGREILLTSDELVIADSKKPVALAGIMGGENSAVNNSTSNIFLESAFFDSRIVRRTSKRFNISTDASYRFERGIDIGEVERLANYTSLFLQSFASGKIYKKTYKCQNVNIDKRNVYFNYDNINKLLGCNIDYSKQKEILNSLNIEILEHAEGHIAIVPTYRNDLERQADLAEEVARIYGYNNIPVTLPQISIDNNPPSIYVQEVRNLRYLLKTLGFSEVINYSFIDSDYLNNFDNTKNFLKLKNPLSKKMDVLRTHIFPSLISNIALNIRKGFRNINVFEISKIYTKYNNGVREEEHLSFAITEEFWPINWIMKEEVDGFYIIKGVLSNILHSFNIDYSVKRVEDLLAFLHPGKSGKIVIDNKEVGFIGEVHPDLINDLELRGRVFIVELILDKVFSNLRVRQVSYKQFSQYPPVYKDLSIVVRDNILAEDVILFIYKISDKISSVDLYDVYKGKGIKDNERSLTFRITFSDMNKTLTDNETNNILNNIIDCVTKEFQAELR
ncbi:MAG: phenylalanine--tRNA ligase subunit beta [Deferribacterota bacterium]|nr:phenylalanine--tRNA ligase subunit beta [Deferribacterota bacterium]